jgi:DHA3 family tetracycline resistance protein-like MFS transporter
MKRRHGDAYTVYLAMTAAEWLTYSLASTVLNVYLATRVTDDPFQLTLLWTTFRITTLLFEIPTGVVADVYSRRLSILIGFVITGLAALIQGAFPRFAIVLLGQVIWGIGFTFVSGARDAWIADEIGEERVGPAYMRGSQIGQVSYLVGIPIGTALGTVVLNLPLIVTGTLYLLLALAVAVLMPEAGFQRQPNDERGSWHSLFSTFLDGVRLVRGRPTLIAILFISAVMAYPAPALTACGQ